jgi:ABC-type ATPase with predicted acetyltransferase domain
MGEHDAPVLDPDEIREMLDKNPFEKISNIVFHMMEGRHPVLPSAAAGEAERYQDRFLAAHKRHARARSPSSSCGRRGW